MLEARAGAAATADDSTLSVAGLRGTKSLRSASPDTFDATQYHDISFGFTTDFNADCVSPVPTRRGHSLEFFTPSAHPAAIPEAAADPETECSGGGDASSTGVSAGACSVASIYDADVDAGTGGTDAADAASHAPSDLPIPTSVADEVLPAPTVSEAAPAEPPAHAHTAEEPTVEEPPAAEPEATIVSRSRARARRRQVIYLPAEPAADMDADVDVYDAGDAGASSEGRTETTTALAPAAATASSPNGSGSAPSKSTVPAHIRVLAALRRLTRRLAPLAALLGPAEYLCAILSQAGAGGPATRRNQNQPGVAGTLVTAHEAAVRALSVKLSAWLGPRLAGFVRLARVVIRVMYIGVAVYTIARTFNRRI
jgi:hypothetical protein